MLVHTSPCKYNTIYFLAEYLKTVFEIRTIILTLVPISSSIHGLLCSEKLQFNIQITFQSVKVWLFCMILNNTTLNVDSVTKTALSNNKKRSVTSWTVPLRALLAQRDTWFGQKPFFPWNWVLIRVSALGFILHQLQSRFRPGIKCRACLWDTRASCYVMESKWLECVSHSHRLTQGRTSSPWETEGVATRLLAPDHTRQVL